VNSFDSRSAPQISPVSSSSDLAARFADFATSCHVLAPPRPFATILHPTQTAKVTHVFLRLPDRRQQRLVRTLVSARCRVLPPPGVYACHLAPPGDCHVLNGVPRPFTLTPAASPAAGASPVPSAVFSTPFLACLLVKANRLANLIDHHPLRRENRELECHRPAMERRLKRRKRACN